MGITKQMNVNDDMINIKDFDPNMLKLDQKTSKDVVIHYIRCKK